MTTSGNIEQKVRQLDNDVHAIYGMLTTIGITQERHTNRLAEITEDIAAIRASVAAHDARFDAHDARFDAVEGRLDAIDGKVDRVLSILER